VLYLHTDDDGIVCGGFVGCVERACRVLQQNNNNN
jgi:hypothetical protein